MGAISILSGATMGRFGGLTKLLYGNHFNQPINVATNIFL